MLTKNTVLTLDDINDVIDNNRFGKDDTSRVIAPSYLSIVGSNTIQFAI